MIDKVLQFIVIGVILFLIVGGIILSLGLADLHRTQESMQEYFEWTDEKAPMSPKEKAFKDSLATQRIFLQYSRIYFDRAEKDSEKQINLTIDNTTLSCETATAKKLNLFRDQLVSKFYHSVLADSLRNNVSSINVTLLVPNRKHGGNCSFESLPDFNERHSYSSNELQNLSTH